MAVIFDVRIITEVRGKPDERMRAGGAVYIMARISNTHPTRPIMEMQSVLVTAYRDLQ